MCLDKKIIKLALQSLKLNLEEKFCYEERVEETLDADGNITQTKNIKIKKMLRPDINTIKFVLNQKDDKETRKLLNELTRSKISKNLTLSQYMDKGHELTSSVAEKLDFYLGKNTGGDKYENKE